MLGTDFGLVPPEIQSALVYAGPGPGPLLATAAAWDGLAAELEAASASYATLISELTATEWLGPAAAGMTAAAAPYLSWMHATGAQAAETAAQAKAGAAAYEEAFTATVPPPVIAVNRAELLTLLATNILGQNGAAIAANQAEYTEMWAQDAAAMYGYAAASAQATRLTAFTAPPKVGDPDGAGTETALAQAAGEGGQNILAQGMQNVPQVLQQLAAPAQAGTVAGTAEEVALDGGVATTAASSLSLSSAYHSAIGSVNFFQRIGSQFFNQFATANSGPSTADLMERMNRIGLVTGAVSPEELAETGDGHHLGFGGFGDWHKWEQWLRGIGSRLGHAFLSAETGQAPSVGGLSVPKAWATAAPEVHLASAAVSSSGAEPAPAAGVGVGSLGAQAALAGAAGRALAGAVVPGPGGGRPSGRKQGTESGIAATDIATALREYAALRDAEIITDTEFNKHKERLMSLDPLAAR